MIPLIEQFDHRSTEADRNNCDDRETARSHVNRVYHSTKRLAIQLNNQWTRREARLPRHDRQHQARRPLSIVEDGLVRAPELCRLAEWTSGVGIAIEPRKVAARHVEPDAVAGHEDVARRADVDRDLARRVRRQQRRRRFALAVARAQDAVGERRAPCRRETRRRASR